MKSAASEDVAAEALANPFRFFPLETVAKMFGFSRDTMTALRELGAPVVAKKCNPGLLLKWLELNADKVGKIRDE